MVLVAEPGRISFSPVYIPFRPVFHENPRRKDLIIYYSNAEIELCIDSRLEYYRGCLQCVISTHVTGCNGSSEDGVTDAVDLHCASNHRFRNYRAFVCEIPSGLRAICSQSGRDGKVKQLGMPQL